MAPRSTGDFGRTGYSGPSPRLETNSKVAVAFLSPYRSVVASCVVGSPDGEAVLGGVRLIRGFDRGHLRQMRSVGAPPLDFGD